MKRPSHRISKALARVLPLVLAVSVAGVAVMPIAAQAQSSCKWYGSTALKQQKRNEQLRCGFTGAQWHSNLGQHMAWCSSMPPEVWKASARERDKMLDQCKAKK